MPGDLQFLTINDFAPGIRHKVFGGGPAAQVPPGAADPAATFRCVVLAGGGLGPLPALAQTKTASLPGSSFDSKCRISGFHVTGPVRESEYWSWVPGVDNVEIHLAYEWITDNLGTWEHRWQWKRVNVWDDEAFITIRTLLVNHPSTFDDVYRATAFVDARLHATDAAELGDIFVAAGWHPDDMDVADNIWDLFPDPANPTANSSANIYDNNETTLMVQHQGRIVSIDNHVFQHGAQGYWVVNDQLVWTQVNLPTFLDEASDGIPDSVGVFTQGPISGYGAVCSASAQELLLVKHRGGATIISGDLDDPTVMSLPGVASTRGATTYGTFTRLGFIYGVRNGGIHSWAGGDTSEKLSPFMDDDFWDMVPTTEYGRAWAGFDGKFDHIRDWILCPNNWIYDIPSQSWWRIEDPDEYQIFQWSASPQSPMFYGAPVDFVEAGPVYYRFDCETLASSYQWQSQYIAQSIDRVVNIREMNLRALSPNGESTVIVTLTNEAGETQSETFDVTSTTIPKLIRKGTAFRGTGIKVKIVASSLDDQPAPTVYELNLGFQLEEQEALS